MFLLFLYNERSVFPYECSLSDLLIHVYTLYVHPCINDNCCTAPQPTVP